MITGRDLDLAKKWEAVDDMQVLDNGGWSITYRNATFPRMTRLVQTASNKPEDPVVKTTFVDDVVCTSKTEIIRLLNEKAPRQRSQGRAA